MEQTIRRIVIIVVMLSCVLITAFATLAIPPNVLDNSNQLLAATVPVSYGEPSFRERILVRTQGERDPVGLVLSGGSARAFAHIGVLQYIEELGIVPDFIISNSMGSLVGILYAAGLSPEQIFTIIAELDITQLFDLSWPISGGILDTSRFTALVAAYLGENCQIEQFPIPIMIVSEDLATKRQVRIMEGNVLEVLEAAFALPVYFSPVAFRGHLLIDGGITNLVPLDIAYDFTDTTIVSTTFYEGSNVNLRNAISILNTSLDIGKRRQGIEALLNHNDTIWIRCDVEDFSFMDFAALPEIVTQGYLSAQLKTQELKTLDARGTTSDMREYRAEFLTKQAQVLSNYHLYTRVKQRKLSQQLFFGLRSVNYQSDPWYLRDEVTMGLLYNLRWKSLWFSMHGGAGWESLSPMKIYPSLTASLSYQMVTPVLFEFDFALSADENWLPTWYHRLALQARKAFIDDQLYTTLQLWWENQLSSDFALQGMLVHGGVVLDWQSVKNSPLDVRVEGAYQLSGNWDRQFLHTRIDTNIPVSRDFYLQLGYTGRYALDALGNVPIYRGDGFKTSAAAVLAQGSLGSTTISPANFMVIGRLGFDWQPQSFKPTAGELLIFEESSLGIYGDMLWHRENQIIPQMAFGARIKTVISLLGLNSLPTSFYIGYDGPTNGIFWGFMFGR
ncbi:MAG: patatin-like phospholipase family protein [Sphaerochaetaceae bacterium]|nr:patatin-like phospholipase family protein [Sphaerochaetaceae bacterium]